MCVFGDKEERYHEREVGFICLVCKKEELRRPEKEKQRTTKTTPGSDSTFLAATVQPSCASLKNEN